MKIDTVFETPILRLLPFLVLGILWVKVPNSFLLPVVIILSFSIIVFGKRSVLWAAISILLFAYPSSRQNSLHNCTKKKEGEVSITCLVSSIDKVNSFVWEVTTSHIAYKLVGDLKKVDIPFSGEKINVFGKLEVYNDQSNDYELFMIKRGYLGKIRVDSVYCIEKAGIWEKNRNEIKDAIIQSEVYNNKTRGIALAAGLGERSYLSKEVKQLFLTSGVFHYLAISGLHVGIVYLILSLTIGVIPIRIRWLKFLLIVGVLFLYAWIAGSQTSIIRAVIMFSFIHWARIFGREKSVLNIVFFSAFLQLLWHPEILFDLGFQLSYSAVLGIVICFPVLSRLLKVTQLPLIPKRVLELFLVGIIAFWWTYPVLISSIGVVYPMGIFLGMTLAPVFFLLTFISFINLPLLWIGGIEYGNQMIHFISKILLSSLETLQTFSFSFQSDFEIWHITLWYLATLLCCANYKAKKLNLVVGIGLLVIIIF